jgi:hypothetical protein
VSDHYICTLLEDLSELIIQVPVGGLSIRHVEKVSDSKRNSESP